MYADGLSIHMFGPMEQKWRNIRLFLRYSLEVVLNTRCLLDERQFYLY